MGQVSNTVAGRITGTVFLAHLVVIPILCIALFYLVEQNSEDQFLDYARGYARFFADGLERVDSAESDALITDILDQFLLSGTGVFSELISDEKRWTTTLNRGYEQAAYTEDFAFGAHNDLTYFISIPVLLQSGPATLHLGFDERPIAKQNRAMYAGGIVTLLLYLIAIMLLVALIGLRATRPIRQLQLVSRDVADGKFSTSINVDSTMVEFDWLARDLDRMRNRLNSVNQSLKKEIQGRKQTEADRAALVSRLNHKQRVETVGTLAGGIAHELNNTLVPILLNLQVAIDELPSDSESRASLVRVLRASNRAKDIVRKILVFSRKTDESKFTTVDLVDVVEQTLALISPVVPKNVEIDVSSLANSASIYGDADMASQLVVNLCTNAYQAMMPAGGKLSVSISTVSLGQPLNTVHSEIAVGDYVVLEISDTGEGIESHRLERIFDPFYTTRAVGCGTGLGLSIVHSITTALHGGIDARSEVSIGSSFKIYLPCVAKNRLTGS